MKKLSLITLILLVIFTGCSKKSTDAAVKKEEIKWNYPETKRELVTDEYFGTKVEDYYRHLENNDAEDVQKWTAAQNELTEKTIFSWAQTPKIEKRLGEVWNYDKMLTPVKRGDKLFYRYQTGLQNQPVLMMQLPDGTKKELVNPNTIDANGTTAMDWWYASPKGRYIAVGLSENGSEQSVLHLIDTDSGKDADKRWLASRRERFLLHKKA